MQLSRGGGRVAVARGGGGSVHPAAAKPNIPYVRPVHTATVKPWCGAKAAARSAADEPMVATDWKRRRTVVRLAPRAIMKSAGGETRSITVMLRAYGNCEDGRNGGGKVSIGQCSSAACFEGEHGVGTRAREREQEAEEESRRSRAHRGGELRHGGVRSITLEEERQLSEQAIREEVAGKVDGVEGGERAVEEEGRPLRACRRRCAVSSAAAAGAAVAAAAVAAAAGTGAVEARALLLRHAARPRARPCPRQC